jgi:hypothetical protein
MKKQAHWFIPVVSRHVRNIFKDGEVGKKSNMQKMHIANLDKPVSLYFYS